MFLLDKKLNAIEKHLSIKISFEGIGDSVFESEDKFSKAFLDIMIQDLGFKNEKLEQFLENENI